jgi:putative ABC transport system permease protein
MSVASMALKNLARQKRRSVLLGGAIAFGLLIITVVNGLSGSLITSLEANLSNLVPGHIFLRGVEKTDKGRIILSMHDTATFEKVVADLKVPVKSIAKTTTIQQAGILSDTATQYQSLTGLDLGPASYIHDRIVVVQGSLDGFAGTSKILLSEGVAAKLGVKLGDRVSVQAETQTGQQNVLDFTVGALYKDPGIAASLAGAYADAAIVNQLRDMAPGEYTNFGIFLDDVATADEWGAKIYQALAAQQVPLWDRGSPMDQLKQYRDQSWKGTKYALFTLNDVLSFLKGIFGALNGIAFAILLVLFVVIMVGITNTYRMVVYERTKEIGTLRALGMQKPQIRRLFLLEAVFLALAGIAVGFVVGVVVLAVVSFVDLSSWKDFNILLKDNKLQLVVDLGSFALNLVVITGLTALAALFPARKAGNLTPAEALRTTN